MADQLVACFVPPSTAPAAMTSVGMVLSTAPVATAISEWVQILVALV